MLSRSVHSTKYGLYVQTATLSSPTIYTETGCVSVHGEFTGIMMTYFAYINRQTTVYTEACL